MSRMISFAWNLLASTIVYSNLACVPHFLEKYQKRSDALDPRINRTEQESKKVVQNQRPSIVVIDSGSFRIPMSSEKVWDSLVDLLIKNYNLSIIDRGSGLLTTEWDTYYLDDQVNRNKLTVRMKKLANNGTELLIYNNVEVLSRNTENTREVWLPSERNKAEVGRIIQNLAITLNLATPQLPQEMMAVRKSSTQPEGQKSF